VTAARCLLGQLPGSGAGLSYDGFLAALAREDAARIDAAIDELRRVGTAFSAAVSVEGGATYDIQGSPTASGDSVVWIADVSALSRAETARADVAAERGRLREIVESLPLPVWRRDGGLRIVDCNTAFAAAVDQPRDAVLTAPSELAPDNERGQAPALAQMAAGGAVQSERRHVVIGGERRLLELTEAPVRDGGTIGFAIDRTDLENAESELARHVNAHGQVLESIHARSPSTAPTSGSASSTRLSRDCGGRGGLAVRRTSLDDCWSGLRERRRVPEYADFRAFKRQQLGMFTSLIEPQTELMHLPDDRTLSVSVSPHPLGGLIFVYEDVTDRLALERSYNTLIEVQRETLDNLFEGIAVFGSDGRLKLHNPAYRKIWALSETDLDGEPHYGDIVEKIRGFYDSDGDWPALRDQVIAQITGQSHWSGRLDRQDGSVLQWRPCRCPTATCC
jgi:PAS domain-containing protein